MTETNIIPATTAKHVQLATQLFLEYRDCLEFDLTFQNFERELADLPGEYAPPTGCILLAEHEGHIRGCVALRNLGSGICEMKRLYVRPAFRGHRIGRILAERAIAEAREIGYDRMRLDTVPSMLRAQRLYRSLGFYEVEAYRYNPIPGTVYLELKL